MNIAIYEIEGWQKKYLQGQFKGHQAQFFSSPVQDEVIKGGEKEAEVLITFIYSRVNKTILDQFPKLKLIITRSTGFDHIDLEEAKRRGVVVCNVPFYGENTVAEHTFGLILSLSRNIHKSYQRTLRHDFSIDGLMGFDLAGKTIGILGTGHIGLHVARIAKGFGMKVLAYDVFHNNFMAEFLHFEYVSLEGLLARSDIVTLHAPHNQHTHHLINQNNIGHFKRGSFLINTARGGLVDTNALLQALDQGILAGAGLDVVEGEEFMMDEKRLLEDEENQQQLQTVVKDQMILDRENVVYTPHLAFYSQEALQRILDTSVENVVAFEQGKPTNKVNL